MDRARRRKFGQNFLDVPTAQMIAGDLPANAGDWVLEIGPGHGALTEHLLERTVQLTAVEIDEQCVEFLQEKFRKALWNLYFQHPGITICRLNFCFYHNMSIDICRG
mgnify:CR=1 FL=1